jgi:hypothetical protein
MNTASKVLLASALALSFAAPGFAQESSPPRTVFLFTDGKMVQMQVTDNAINAMMMKNFKPLKPGMMIYVSGGKLYIAADKRMRDGKMLSTEIFGAAADRGSSR